MKIKIHGHRLLILPAPIETKTASGIVLAKPGNLEKQERRASERGTVLQVGDTCWHQWDYNDPAWKPWCKEGDEIYFVRYSGKFITHNDVEYLVINDEDVLAVIDDKE